VVCNEHGIGGSSEYCGNNDAHFGRINVILSPANKRTEGRGPVWGSEYTTKGEEFHKEPLQG
jgi:hypothetical protein